ncbi:hypothetical protein [Brackiella oedipodis]|uniref:hypothetical protein n=1 Tax=Brackiella oedipodis TaxID=124225 RepID=UPI000A8A00D1|nr:hypothetical protein [Brackiella oedipodis]
MKKLLICLISALLLSACAEPHHGTPYDGPPPPTDLTPPTDLLSGSSGSGHAQ